MSPIPDREPDSDVERLYEAPKFILEQEVWKWLEEGAVGHLEAYVWTDKGEGLQLRASVTKGNLKIVLTCRRTQLVRKWDSHDGHRNPGGELVSGSHKHYPTKTHPNGEFAYPTPDVPDTDINDALLAFMSECNIDLRTGFQRHF